MKTLLTSTALVALMAGVSPAMAECNIGKTTEYTQQDDAVMAGARRDLRQLRNSAMILETYGKDNACQQVVSAIEEIRDNRGRMPAADNQAANQPADTDTTAAVEPVDYEQMMADAKPVSDFQGRLTVDKMMDADVRGANGNVVGEISNIILNNDGEPSHAVVAFGGFLGLGEDRVAIPYSKLKTRVSVADLDDMVFFVPMTEEQIANAPRVQQDDDNWMSDESWVSQNDEYYDNNSIES